MKDERYADPNHVVQALTNHVEEGGDEGRITVLDTDVVARGVTAEELDERNVWATHDRVDDSICYLDWGNRTDFGVPTVRLKFHEKVVERPLKVMPAGPRAIDPDQATKPQELGERLKRALRDVDEQLDPIYTFVEVSAASMANGGHFTDFEYEYAVDFTASLT